MTTDELRTAIETLWPGHGGQTRAAEYLGLKTSRRIREYLSGERGVPEWVARDIGALLAQFPGGAPAVDPSTTIRILHEQMQQAKWDAKSSAAGILGAAYALATEVLGDDARLLIEDRY